MGQAATVICKSEYDPYNQRVVGFVYVFVDFMSS